MELDNNQESSSQLSANENVAGDNGTTPPEQTIEAQPSALLEKIKEKARTVEQVAPPARKPSEEAAQAAAAAAPPAYKANYKFKAAGKEYDVPELLRGVMKDPDAEKYIHQVLSKAHGIEMIQGKLKETREARDQISQAYQQVMEPISYAKEAYGRGDMDTVFSTLKIDPNKVLQWAYNKVQLSQMPPDQRQVHEQRQYAERRAWELERQTAFQAQQGASSQAEMIEQMLGIVLERPEIQAIAQAYDTRKQKEGSFRELVAMMGDQEFQRSGKIIPVQDAVKAAVELLGEKFGAPAVTAPAAPATQAPAAQPAAPENKPKITLPNAGGSKSAAPAKAKVKTLDDIRKLHQKMASSN